MAKDYKELKVNELKELLKARELTTSGTKNELIARLEAHDAESADANGDQPLVEQSNGEAPTETAPEASTAVVTEAIAKDSSAENALETVGEHKVEVEAEAEAEVDAAPKEAEPELTVESVLADLQKKIERNQRFGESTEDLEAQVRRIKKFGIEAYKASHVSTKPSAFRDRHSHRHKRRNLNKKKSTGVVKS